MAGLESCSVIWRMLPPMPRLDTLRRGLLGALTLIVCGALGSCYEVHDIGGGRPDGGGGGAACRGASGEFVEGDYRWQDITRGGERLRSLSVDDGSERIELGFSFPFFGERFDRGAVSTNGFVQLGRATSATAFSNVRIPRSQQPNALVAPFWDDLDLGSGGGAVFVDQAGSRPDRRATVTWEDVPFLGERGRVTFQAIFHEDGVIEFQYRSLDRSSRGAGSSATVGIEDERGREGVEYSFDRPSLREELNLTYCP